MEEIKEFDTFILNYIKELYSKNENITEALLKRGIEINAQIIEMIYDLQSGTYTKDWLTSPDKNKTFAKEIVQHISKLIEPGKTLLDAGVGEGSTLIPILAEFGKPLDVLAFDISWSRLSWATENAFNNGMTINFAVADLLSIPLADASVDYILTVHALEPNGGQETKILKELSRVVRRFVFLVEPDWDIASPEQKLRMKSLNYIGSLNFPISNSGLRIVSRSTIKSNSNQLNAASIFILEKIDTNDKLNPKDWMDPILKEPLLEFEGGLRGKSGLWYPVLRNIPFLWRIDAKSTISPRK